MQSVSLAVFIPVAESNGLIQQITAQVMDIVARDAVALIAVGPDTQIASNFWSEDLPSPETEVLLIAMLGLAGARSSDIMTGATERGLMKPEQAKAALISVRAQGFRFAIDDFSTGNSSFLYPATYDLDMLKIDKIFVESFERQSPTT